MTEDFANRVLVFAPIGRDAQATADLLGRAGISADLCGDYDDFIGKLGENPEAVFVAEEGLFGRPLKRLADWVAQQPPWSDLPFVVLTSRHDQSKVTDWRQRLVQQLGNVSLLERPVQPITLVSVMQAALRARQRQVQIHSLLEAREQAAQQLESLVVERTIELQDVNVQLRAEMAERSRVEESLRHAQKLEALGQLTGGVAHDFNNLLMVIMGGLDMFDRVQDPPRRARMLQGMRQAAQRGAGLTRQLLAFSRSHALRPETVDLSRQLHDMKELLDRSLRGDVQVEVRMAAGLWPIEVDPGELELVLLNLAVNARDAIASGGTITVRGENHPDWQGDGLSGDFVSLSVIDNGAGMSEEVKARVFEPFFTTKDVGKGSGLGLAQVYGFAQQSGGTVHIESALGRGTKITLMLPRSHKPFAANHEATARSDAVRQAEAGCVLLVEDDGQVAALVTDMLRDLGYDVLHASNAEAALGALADARRVDFVFSDIMMPGGTSGLELAHKIRKHRPQLPILLTSGFLETSRVEAQEMGIPVLAKPYGLHDLQAAVTQLLVVAE